MAIAFRGASTPVFAFNADVAITFPAAALTGDLLVIYAHGTPTGFNTPAGWTLYKSFSSAATGDELLYIFWKFYDSGSDGASVTITRNPASGSPTIGCYAYSGVINAVNPITADSGVVGFSNNATNPLTETLPSFSPTINGTLLAGFGFVGNGAGQTLDNFIVTGVAATIDSGPLSIGSEGHYAWSKLQAAAGSTGTCSYRANGGTKSGEGVLLGIQPPNPYSRPAYIFGAQQAVNRASTF